jgi:transcriptional regulator ATRX
VRAGARAGSPLQNNLTEYHCMIDFINHGFLGSLNEFRNQFEIPIMNGEAKDAAAADVKRMKWRNHVLTKKLEPMIQRKDFTPLVQSLPPKYEFTLKIRLTAIQKRLYKHAIDNREECGMFSVLKAFHTLLKIWNHPFVLCQTAKGDDTSLVSQDLGGLSHSHGLGSIGGSMRGDVPLLEEEEDSDCQVLGEDTFPKQHGAAGAHAMGNGGASHGSAQYNPMWFRRILEEEHVSPEKLCDVECSGKLLVLWKLLHEADEQNEKVLVFSQSLAMLDVIEQVLKKNPVGSSCWKPGHDYYRLDGSKSSKQRQGDIDNFNDIANTRARLFLISTRAGSLGVNMVAANRVVLFDCNFNPSYDLQAIFRTYRYGQTRPCFVYRLVSWGTMEEKIYKRQINKQSRAARAVDSWQVERHYKKEDLMLDQQLLALEEDEEVLKVDSDDDDESVDEGMVGHSDVKKAMKSDTILRAMVDKTFVSTARNKHHKMDRYDKLRRSLIRAVSLDESLVCDKEAEQLSREEQAAATEDYEMAQKADRAAPTVAAKAKPCPRCNQPLTIKPTQEKFGCPSCKGIFRASSSACIGELVTDPATGATVPRLFPESDPSRPGKFRRALAAPARCPRHPCASRRVRHVASRRVRHVATCSASACACQEPTRTCAVRAAACASRHLATRVASPHDPHDPPAASF